MLAAQYRHPTTSKKLLENRRGMLSPASQREAASGQSLIVKVFKLHMDALAEEIEHENRN